MLLLGKTFASLITDIKCWLFFVNTIYLNAEIKGWLLFANKMFQCRYQSLMVVSLVCEQKCFVFCTQKCCGHRESRQSKIFCCQFCVLTPNEFANIFHVCSLILHQISVKIQHFSSICRTCICLQSKLLWRKVVTAIFLEDRVVKTQDTDITWRTLSRSLCFPQNNQPDFLHWLFVWSICALVTLESLGPVANN